MFTGTLQLRWLSDENLYQLLAEYIKQHLNQLTLTQTSKLNLSWLHQIWDVLIKRGIDKFAKLPLLPLLTSGKWETDYTVRLVSLTTSSLLLQ